MQVPNNFNLIVTPQEADAIVTALRKTFPMEMVEEFVNKLRMQLNAQVAAVNSAPAGAELVNSAGEVVGIADGNPAPGPVIQ